MHFIIIAGILLADAFKKCASNLFERSCKRLSKHSNEQASFASTTVIENTAPAFVSDLMNFQLGHFNPSDKPPFITSNVSSTESVNALADISSLDFSGVTNFNRNNTHNNAHKDPFKKFISITYEGLEESTNS
ncbi:hypothetical protein E3P81_03129 [Wallemia ichthyophaga]|nr:hypothetical protein E3P81_03129 [Wallemia ichthyophaga]